MKQFLQKKKCIFKPGLINSSQQMDMNCELSMKLSNLNNKENAPSLRVEKLKRVRASNWDEQEKWILIEVIKPHLDIIEEKKKSTSANRKKEDCWKKVQLELSAQGYTRDLARIKEQWTRLKLQSKKRVLEQKIWAGGKATGDGSAPESPSEFDLVVAEAVPHLFFVDHNKHDGDDHPVDPLKQPTRICIERQDNIVSVQQPLHVDVDDIALKNSYKQVDEQDRVLQEIPQADCETPLQILNKTRVNKRRAEMSAYEEQMLKLNKVKFEQEMRYAKEMHELKMKNEEQLYNLKIKYETLLYERKLTQ